MPLYEYQCQSCGHVFETMQRMADAPLTSCPKCEGPLKKLVSAPAFQFKGSGWYVTDYSRSGTKAEGKTEGGDAKSGGGESKADGGGSGESKPSDSSATKVDKPATPAKPSSTSD